MVALPPVDPQEPQEVHPLYIRQEAEKVALIFSRLYVNRGIAFFGIGVAITFWLTNTQGAAGFIFLIAGVMLLAASYNKALYDRALRNFEKRFEISPQKYLAEHPGR